MDERTKLETSAQLRELASVVRGNPSAREAIASGFELIADAMKPCVDCGHPDMDELDTVPMVRIGPDVIHPDDNPETGA
jgi:hypothetical protein